jgi:2-dehydropantoate 2-reductase
MRILVVGAGATGGVFGGRLAQAGRDVTFLVRPSRAESLRAHGLQITGVLGDLTLQPQLTVTGEIASTYDLILLGVKAYALEAAIDDFAPAVGPATTILPMLNGMRHIDLLVERFGERAVVGGVCIVSSTLDDRGRIVMLRDVQQLSYGERGGGLSPRTQALDAALQGAGFSARASEEILQEMWEKWVFLAALGAATCLLRGTVGAIAAAGGSALALQMLDECVAVAAASHYPPREAFLANIRGQLTDASSQLASSMYRDLQQGRRVEADQILGDLLARAQRAKIDTPLVAAAYAQLRIYQSAATP